MQFQKDLVLLCNLYLFTSKVNFPMKFLNFPVQEVTTSRSISSINCLCDLAPCRSVYGFLKHEYRIEYYNNLSRIYLLLSLTQAGSFTYETLNYIYPNTKIYCIVRGRNGMQLLFRNKIRKKKKWKE